MFLVTLLITLITTHEPASKPSAKPRPETGKPETLSPKPQLFYFSEASTGGKKVGRVWIRSIRTIIHYW